MQYLSELITSTVAKSLNKLFVFHGVESQLANALAAVRATARRHAAVRQITSKDATRLKQQLPAPPEEWVGMCMQLAPSGVSTGNPNALFKQARTVLKRAGPETDGFKVAFEVLLDMTVLDDKEPVQQTMRMGVCPYVRNMIWDTFRSRTANSDFSAVYHLFQPNSLCF